MLLHSLAKSEKQAINDKLQGSVATYLMCGGDVNNQIKKGLLMSVWVRKFSKSVSTWQSYKQERGCLMHFARLANTLLTDEENFAHHVARHHGSIRLCQRCNMLCTSAFTEDAMHTHNDQEYTT